jgi:hypothetical protein
VDGALPYSLIELSNALMQLIKLTGLSLCLAATAAAQVTAVGPFVGDQSDGFETQVAGQFSLCIQGRMFNNTGDLCSPTGQATMHITGGWGFMCSIPPHSGTRLFGSAGGPAEFTFDTDVTQFGGYFGTNSWAAGNPANDFVTVEFRDRMGNLIDTETAVVTPDCQYTWNGWSSGTGIASVTVINSAFGGGFVNLDDMEITFGAGSIGTNYCTANANSTGQTGDMSASGSTSVAANNLTIEASDLPMNAFGYFLTSLTQANIPNPGGSLGVLCLGGNIGRYTGPGQIQNTGTGDSFDLLLDLTQIPTPTGFVPAVAGQARNFQAWHRDSVGGVAVSNFTDGLEITFTP